MSKLVVLVLMGLIAASCASGSDDSDVGPVAPGDEVIAGMCAEDHPDCLDMVVQGDAPKDVPTGGNLPPAPSSNDDGVSNGLIVGNGLSIPEAMAFGRDEVLAIGGFVVIDSNGARLCEVLAESLPPQCGGASLTVTNPDELLSFPLVEEGTVQWSQKSVVVLGRVNGNDLTIEVGVSS